MRRALVLVLLLGMPAALRAEITPEDVAVVVDTDGSIEESATAPDTYLMKVACAFYKDHPDAYDAIFVFTTLPGNFFTNVQQGWPVQQRTKGIGRDLLYNNAPKFCARQGRLRHAVKMGDLKALPNNPDDYYTGILMYGLSGIELMGHEFGHQWLASIEYRRAEDTENHCALRGWEGSSEPQPGELMCDGWTRNGYNQHWSYYLHNPSVMYGSEITDLGGGKFRIRTAKPFKFSPLDQYLMGLRLPGEVPPFFHVLDPNGYPPNGSASLPSRQNEKGTDFTGIRVDVTIEDVLRVHGERVPPLEKCHWKGALILVTNATWPQNPTALKKVADYGNRWEAWYDEATDHRGSFDLTRDGRGYGTPTCPSGLVPPPPDEGAEETLPEPSRDVQEPPDAPAADLPSPPDWSHVDFGQAADESADPGTAGPDRGPGTADLPDAAGTGSCVPMSRKCMGQAILLCSQAGQWALLRNCADGEQCIEDGVCAAIGGKSGGCDAAPSRDLPLPLIALAVLAALSALVRRRSRPDAP